MIVAVNALVWTLFGVVLALCAALIVRMLMLLLRRLKDFREAAARATEALNEAMTEVNDLLRDAEEGMSRVQGRKLRDR